MERLYGRRMCSTMEAMEHEIREMGMPKMMIWPKMDIDGATRRIPITFMTDDAIMRNDTTPQVDPASEQRWLPFRLRAHDKDAFARLSRRNKVALLKFDNWWKDWVSRGYGSAPPIHGQDISGLQHLRLVGHRTSGTQSEAIRQDISSNDINVRVHMATTIDWKNGPVWNPRRHGNQKCTHPCEQQACLDANDCNMECHFQTHHTILHLCRMHWKILVYEEDSEGDEPRLSLNSMEFKKASWIEDF